MYRFLHLKIFFILFVVLSLSACENDEDSADMDLSAYSTLGELIGLDGNNYYIKSDLNQKFYILNPEVFLAEQAKVGDRVYADFKVESDVRVPSPCDYAVYLKSVYKVQTKYVVALTPENEKFISDDNIEVSNIWISGDYLNFSYTYYTDGVTVHDFNLVTVDNPKREENGYIYMEFRHNANYDHNQISSVHNGIVSFDIDDLDKIYPNIKGLILRVNRENGERFYKVELDDDDNDDDDSDDDGDDDNDSDDGDDDDDND